VGNTLTVTNSVGEI